MRYIKYRDLENNQVYTLIVFAAMNLKKLSTWQLERMSSYLLLYLICQIKLDKISSFM